MIKDHVLSDAQLLPSPNHNERPDPGDISLLVIHNISLPPGEFGGSAVAELFLNTLNPDEHPFFAQLRDIKVSAHLFIRRDGHCVQFVPFNKRAWHAGQSSYAGLTACNDFSIGIELEGTDHRPFEDAQYQALIRVTGDILDHYPKITIDRIVGHSDIAPGRKTDPGPAFDWERYKTACVQRVSNQAKSVLPRATDQ